MESLTKNQQLTSLLSIVWAFLTTLFGSRTLAEHTTNRAASPPITNPLTPEIEAMFAELLDDKAPSVPVASNPAPPVKCVSSGGMTSAEIEAALEALFPANDTAEIPTIDDRTEDTESHVAPGSFGRGADGCAVATSSPLPRPHAHTRPLSLAERFRVAKPTPLEHLFGKTGGAFKPPTFVPGASWARSTSSQKFEQGIRSAQSRKAVAISCNLSADREQALLMSKNPTETLSTYIGREMRRSFGGRVLPYAFQFEFNDAGRLHIHGVVLLDRATEQELGAVKHVLATACGNSALIDPASSGYSRIRPDNAVAA